MIEFFKFSGVGSASKLRDLDDEWQDPRLSTTDDDLVSPYSDSSTNELDQIRPQAFTKNGTYVIRRGRKKERKGLPKAASKTKSLSFENSEKNRLSDVKRYSSTFDNIKSLLREKKLEASNDPPIPAEFASSLVPPDLVRVISLPAINDQPDDRGQLEVTVEEEETLSDLDSDKDKKRREEIELARLSSSGFTSFSLSLSLSLATTGAGTANDQNDRCEDGKQANVQRIGTTCNGTSLSASNSYSKGFAAATAATTAAGNVSRERIFIGGNSYAEEQSNTKKSSNCSLAVGSEHRLVSKIPVNLLIEDQIVKKALKENRRQLEKVSDAIKEIESVKNSESYTENKRWKSSGVTEGKHPTKRNSLEIDQNELNERQSIDEVNLQVEEARAKKQRDSDVDSDASKTSPKTDFDGRRANGTDVHSSGRRSRQKTSTVNAAVAVENHRNDQKQIENVIDAILQDSKNPDFQVCFKLFC